MEQTFVLIEESVLSVSERRSSLFSLLEVYKLEASVAESRLGAGSAVVFLLQASIEPSSLFP